MNLFPVNYHFLGTYKYGRHLDRLGCFYEDADEDGAICIVPFCMLLLAYHVSNIAPARNVAPRSHSTPSPHIAARSHIASNLHLALPSLISWCILRIISLILHLVCIYFMRRSYFAAQSAHFSNIVIVQKNILGPGLYLITTRVF